MNPHAAPPDLFDLTPVSPPEPPTRSLGPGATLLRGFARASSSRLIEAIEEVARQSPFRRMTTPGGFQMSVAMTNCGDAGWITDRNGYRYGAHDPLSGLRWPPMPPVVTELATRSAAAGGFAGFIPDACLINQYEPGARLSLHQDKDERNLGFPVVSVSLGLQAVFLFGGPRRTDRTQPVLLEHGDVVVWGGPSRLWYHGVRPLKEGAHAEVGRRRINLTFRKAL
jgi:DNA oxidative demethylase